MEGVVKKDNGVLPDTFRLYIQSFKQSLQQLLLKASYRTGQWSIELPITCWYPKPSYSTYCVCVGITKGSHLTVVSCYITVCITVIHPMTKIIWLWPASCQTWAPQLLYSLSHSQERPRVYTRVHYNTRHYSAIIPRSQRIFLRAIIILNSYVQAQRSTQEWATADFEL